MAASLSITALIFGFLGWQQLWYVRGGGKFAANKEEVRLTKVQMPKPKQPPPRPRTLQDRKQRSDRPDASLVRNLDWVGQLSQAGGRGAVWAVGGEVESMAGGPGGSPDQDARPIVQAPPAYPEKARKYGVHGQVRVLLTIGVNGTVKHLEFLETPGNYGFEEVVREAVEKWKYRPAMSGGVPVEQRIEQPFQF